MKGRTIPLEHLPLIRIWHFSFAMTWHPCFLTRENHFNRPSSNSLHVPGIHSLTVQARPGCNTCTEHLSPLNLSIVYKTNSLKQCNPVLLTTRAKLKQSDCFSKVRQEGMDNWMLLATSKTYFIKETTHSFPTFTEKKKEKEASKLGGKQHPSCQELISYQTAKGQQQMIQKSP